MHCTGILLAAGRGRRFDPTGVQNKLLQRCSDGEAVALRAARQLVQVLPKTLVVVHADAHDLRALLEENGFITTACPSADNGMGHSLAHAIGLSENPCGWIIALADMPQVRASTIAVLDAAIGNGADIAVPTHHGVRGNPVGFSRYHRDALLQLHGDRGARNLLTRFPVIEVAVDDPGIFFDIDTPLDLQKIS